MMLSKQTYIYKIVKGCEIQADVYRMPDDVIQPVILWLHGGALIFGDRGTISAEQLERYVKAGYTIVAADYRLAPEVKIDAILEDVLDAYQWISIRGSDLFQIDPGRIAVIGHSAGGYLALMAGLRARPRPKAIVALYGYGDICGPWYSRPDRFYNQQAVVPKNEAYRGVAGSILTGTPFEGQQFEERSRFYIYCRQQGLWPKEVAGHDPDEDPKWFRPFCPVHNISPEYPPTLLIHGDQDEDVPFAQSELMVERLALCGVKHEFIRMRNYPHAFDNKGGGMKDPAIANVFDKVLAFLEKHGMK